ncbi:MAG: hypothetical protein ACOC9Y_04995 [Chloroflexota bacterium]
MICEVHASLEEKIEAIRDRTADQRMEREGVPVLVGGQRFEVRPPVRRVSREFRRKQAEVVAALDDVDMNSGSVSDVLHLYASLDDGTMELACIAVPELAERGEEWIDDNATNEELAEINTLMTEFLNPNAGRVGAITTENGNSASPTPTPSSATATPPTRSKRSKKS